MTLTEFLEQEISKDEEVARTAAGWDRSGRERVPGVWIRSGVNSVESVRGLVVYGDGPAPNDAEAEHVARFDPARVLAECQVKRAIVEDAQRSQASLESQRLPATDAVNGHVIAQRRVVRWLALPYADHPDYQQEWRP